MRSWGGVSVGGFDVGGRGEVGDGHEDEDEGEGEGLRGRLWEVGLFRFARALRVVEVGFLEGVVLRFRREGVVDADGYDREIDIESEGEGGEGEGRKLEEVLNRAKDLHIRVLHPGSGVVRPLDAHWVRDVLTLMRGLGSGGGNVGSFRFLLGG